ncbi:MAG: helix-turn-helix transcriptional regulator [Planctomycetes bacterium]|nr:helix-turn-helix transcriptional regulator [Planctomycetota bacterium]
MIAFDDFDAWGDAVSGAHLRLVCDRVETRRWTLGIVKLGSVVLQMATEGGGNACYGGNTHDGAMVFLPLMHPHEHIVNGESLDDDSLLVIPRGADFRICVRRRAHAWCSIALPNVAATGGATATSSTRVACHDGGVRRLRQLVEQIGVNLMPLEAQSPAHESAGATILSAALGCWPRTSPTPATVGRPRLDRAEIIRRSMAVIEEAGAVLPSVSDLASSVGVTDRTLLRVFMENFGASPRTYLALRRLHAVRRSLLRGGRSDTTVAAVLVRHGIWEFSRFAARYRRQFGETPSETLSRAIWHA